MMNKPKLALAVTLLGVLGGCMNMPTPASQITGSYTSGCWRRLNIDHLCRLNIDQGRDAVQ